MTAAARLASWAVRAYQAFRAGRVSPCRFAPSCSNYALEALREHGALRGLRLTACRLLRCHPWNRMRSDPVPPRVRPAMHGAAGACQVTAVEKFDV